MAAVVLFPTTLVGSYPQPEWLIDRQKLAARFPPRVRARELWRIPEAWLEEAQNDATLLAIAARNGPASTSSPTARSVVRATPTGSPPRWTAWTPTTQARRWTAPGIPTRSPASWGPFGAGVR